ncbi:MAG TPA: CocE/NonD family hydrolase [Actinomycetota bacterium]|nr:CocE/NonD family hydrolase [Actinomycetota bacterium]
MRRVVSLFVVLALGAAGVIAAPTAGASNEYVASEQYFEAPDGTKLYAQVFRPADAGEKGKTPVILVITPYQSFLNLSVRPTLLYPELANEMQVFEKGYTVVQASLRGYGKSDGCGDFGGPGEQMDAVAAVEWAAGQEWSTGKVGTYGISYDAWTQMMAYAGKAPLSAAVVSSPLISAYRGLYMNGVHYAGGWHATPGLYGAIDLTSPGAPTEDSATCYPENTYETARHDPSTSYWKVRNLIKKAGNSKVPTLWSHGLLDPQTKPDNFLDVYSALDGYKRAWFGQFIHRIPDRASGNERFYEEVVHFFDRFLQGKNPPADPPVEIQEGSKGVWRTERQWPPADSTYRMLPVKPGTYQDSYADDTGAASQRGTWSFSQPMPYDVHVSGVPKMDLRVDSSLSGIHVHARLFDVDGTRATLVSRGAALVEGDGAITDPLTEARVRFELYPQDWVLEKGHRIGVLISGADNSWFDPGTTESSVTAYGGFKLPFLRFERDRALPKTTPGNDRGRIAYLTVDTQTIAERTIRMPLPPRLR